MSNERKILAPAKKDTVPPRNILGHFVLLIMIFSCGCTNPNFNMSTYEDGLLYFINSPEERNLRTATEMVGQTIISSEFMSTQIPPGMYEDYGTLLFREGKNQESRKALAKEMEIYPESRKFLQPMFEGISTSRDNKIIPPQSEPKGAPSFGNTIRSNASTVDSARGPYHHSHMFPWPHSKPYWGFPHGKAPVSL